MEVIGMTRTRLMIGICTLGIGFAGVALGDEAQVKRGAKLYAQHCAHCHGDAGDGGRKAPPVVGKAALPLDPPASAKFRKTQFRTARDVADFVVKNMPAKKPGSLKIEDYWAILAFDLSANGVELASKEKV